MARSAFERTLLIALYRRSMCFPILSLNLDDALAP